MPFAGGAIRQYVRVANPLTPNYFEVFSDLACVYLEDSWVLGVIAGPNACVFRLEAVLTPDHPLFRTPSAGEQYCYAPAILTLSSGVAVSFKRSALPPATDATGERDWGNIDTFVPVDWEGRDAWSLEGLWGELVIAEPAVGLVFSD